MANSLVFAANGQPLLVMACGSNRVDTAKLAQQLSREEVQTDHTADAGPSGAGKMPEEFVIPGAGDDDVWIRAELVREHRSQHLKPRRQGKLSEDGIEDIWFFDCQGGQAMRARSPCERLHKSRSVHLWLNRN
jgi:hypothetical protein